MEPAQARSPAETAMLLMAPTFSSTDEGRSFLLSWEGLPMFCATSTLCFRGQGWAASVLAEMLVALGRPPHDEVKRAFIAAPSMAAALLGSLGQIRIGGVGHSAF